MAIARRTSPRYADAVHLASLGLREELLRVVPGYFGAVTRTGVGAGTITPGGSPAGVYDLRVRVSTGGAPGVAAVEVSLNGGTSYGAPLAVPSGGVVAVPGTSSSIAAGMTLTVAGTLATGDVYACDAASKVEIALDGASDWLDGHLRARFVLPLTAWGTDLARAAAAAAALDVLNARGYDPRLAADAVVRAAWEDAQKWAAGVAAGRIVPAVTDSAQPASRPSSVVVVSRPRRGW